ncbi:MAG TPA: ABC transporter permease, partial [Bryobacteraceae bacterium]|nr:ABC transporter permease [Bryobacteraceae bacterium]
MNAFFRKLSWLTRRRRKEDELRAELQFHLEEEAEERRVRGLANEEALLAARRELGNITLVQESTRATWTWNFWEQLLQDLRYAARTMRNNKAFTALAALSLALGIGANTAIYSFMDAIMLRSLPVSDPGSLVVLNWRAKDPRERPGKWRPFVMRSMSGSSYEDSGNTTSGIFPFPAFELFHDNSSSVFSSVFAYYPAGKLNVMVKDQAELTDGEYVSGDYFRGLAVPPAAGRLIYSDDDRAGAPAVVVLSFAFSKRRFGDASSAAGQSISINNVPFTVIGVTPPEFFGVDPAADPDFYVPMHSNIVLDTGVWGAKAAEYLDKNYYWIEVMARLRPGVKLIQAQAALAPPFHQWVESTANEEERANLPALLIQEGAGGLDNLRRQYSKPLYVLLAMVGLI